jgi:membrane-associated protein
VLRRRLGAAALIRTEDASAARTRQNGGVTSLANGITHLAGWVAYLVIAALVFGETAVFLGFVLPGEIAVVLGGVLASRGHLSLPLLIVVVVAAAIAGPFVGYEIGGRMGDRLFTSRALGRVQGGGGGARSTLRQRGGLAVLAGRFVAVVRALMPAAAGAAGVGRRTFAVYNIIGGVVWGVGYSLLGYLAGSAYAAVAGKVGTGLAVAIAALIVAAAAGWAWRRHRAAVPAGAGGPAAATAPGGPPAASAADGLAADKPAGSGQASA